jgi:hypothetical protein
VHRNEGLISFLTFRSIGIEGLRIEILPAALGTLQILRLSVVKTFGTFSGEIERRIWRIVE